MNLTPARHLYGWNHHAALPAVDPLRSRSASAPPSAPPLPAQDIKFSIVIPTLNQADTIEDTLISIVGQNYQNMEIIVIDGGSSDQTLDILSRYSHWITRLISESDNGQADAINRGFEFAQGDIYAWINSDDYYLPGTFHKVNALFSSNHDARFVVGAGDVISKQHSFLRHIPSMQINSYTIENWMNDRWIMQQSCFWCSSLWEEVGGVDTSLTLLMDVDLWFRFSKVTTTYMIPDTLAVMRYYKAAKTVRLRSTSYQEMAYVYARYGAFDCVRAIVAELVSENASQSQLLSEFQAQLPVRVMKKLRLLPR